MPSISITTPANNGTVGSPFIATGNYSSGSPSPQITVVLKDSSGNVVATANPVLALSGAWTGSFNPSHGYTGATVEATLVGTTASASVTNITVT